MLEDHLIDLATVRDLASDPEPDADKPAKETKSRGQVLRGIDRLDPKAVLAKWADGGSPNDECAPPPARRMRKPRKM